MPLWSRSTKTSPRRPITTDRRRNHKCALAPREQRAEDLVKSTKGLTLIWSRTAVIRIYKVGGVFLGGRRGSDAKQISRPKPPKNEKRTRDDAERRRRPRSDSPRFRLSPKGNLLVASNKEGLWIVDNAAAALPNVPKSRGR